MERFFGGNPAAVAIRLAVLSLIVGVILSALGLSPYDLIESVTRLIRRIYDLGFGAVESLVRYFLLGAILVVPIWLATRLLRLSGRGERRPIEYGTPRDR